MRIQFLTSYYPPFLKSFYYKNPFFSSLSYEEMQERLLSEYFADTGALYSYTILRCFPSFLIISNCEPIQKQWAKENGITYNESNWEKEIALEQIKKFKPDIFYIESVFEFFGTFLGEAAKYSKKVVAWIATPYTQNLKLNNIDLIISSSPNFVKQFRNAGIKSEHMLPAFDARVIGLIEDVIEKDIQFSFVGGWSPVHVNRKNALEKLVKKTPIQIWGYGYDSKPQISKKSFKYYTNFIFPHNRNILKAYHGELWGLNMYKVLKRSVMTFNIHEALISGNVGNMRMFEATGVGTMLLNDNGTNLADMFIPGKEIEVYNTIDEAIEKFEYYIKYPQKAIEMGRNAQLRTIKDYNYDIFLDHLLSHISKI